MPQINHVNLGDSSYDIYIAANILQDAGKMIAKIYSGTKIAVLTDETVYKLYGNILMASLKAAGFDAYAIVMQPGEETKSMQNFAYVLSNLAQNGITRKDLLVAFGGGVIGDLGGFTAASYMRGIKYVQIPTTLLAQVDSSVGGKTAVNLPEGKNLVGAFWQPKMVIADTQLLTSLDDRQFASGMAEVIKYGCIFSKSFFDLLCNNAGRQKSMQVMPQIIYNCCDLKRMVVEQDEKDLGRRMLLNFGHTFGHAVEKLGGYTQYTHGEGVAIGMLLACRAGAALGVTDAYAYNAVKQLCADFCLPVNDKVSPSAIAPLVAIDKKSGNGSVNLILIKNIGESVIYSITLNDFNNLMHEGENQWKN